MLLLTFKVFGWTVAHTPEVLLRWLSTVLGDAIFAMMRSRRRLILSNLHHAFPHKPSLWRRRIGRESCRRMVETGLLSLATPYLSESRIRKMGRLAPSVEVMAADIMARPHPVVLATVHFALWESQTWLKLLSPIPLPEFGIIFRPLDNRSADRFVKDTRQRFGMRLLSRKEGFADALKILRGNGCVGILFDQNAGMQGALTLLFDRVCSTTELPGLLAAKFGAEVRTFYPRRVGFWRVEFESEPVPNDGSTEGITVALNRWLETTLRNNEELCASWLWAHARWRNQDVPARRLRLEAKRDLLPAAMATCGHATLPRRTRIWVRMPNWLGDVVMAIPLLRAIRASRRDAEITLVAKKAFLPLLSAAGVADHLHALPPRGIGYWAHFWRIRSEYIDTWLLFTNSMRGDIEARLTGCRQRFGIVRHGKWRPLLSHGFRVSEDFNEAQHHQLELWDNFLRHFGLAAAPDREPLFKAGGDRHGRAARDRSAASAARVSFGIIPGSENTPEKRWPVTYWRQLIEAFPEAHFVIFGTANDRPIADVVADGFESSRVENLAGKTDLTSFMERLSACALLVTNDTGGMHLANALGVPQIGLFGPTNPIRTGPVFAGPARILQPSQCPPTGGGALADLLPDRVIAEVRSVLAGTRN